MKLSRVINIALGAFLVITANTFAKSYFAKACDLNLEVGCKAYAHLNNGGQ